jgi:ABC-type ATPase with predicted acetyltransferase domain
MSNNWPALLVAERDLIERAKRLLTNKGIGFRGTKVLRVEPARYDESIRLIRQDPKLDKAHQSSGTAWWNCHSCRTELNAGDSHCPKCGSFVRD